MPAPRPIEIDWYDTPRWYDVIFAPDTRREADFIEAMLQRHGPRSVSRRQASAKSSSTTTKKGGVRVLEPACGSGRLVIELARRGHAVTGFDLNAAMLERARERLRARSLEACVEHGDMRSFRFHERFEVAHCLVSTFKYLLDEPSAREHLECVARHLVPGGIYVLGFHLTDYERDSVSQERWVETTRGARVTCNTRVWPADRRTRLEDVRARLVIERGTDVLRTETRWKFRAYDERQALRLFASVPALECVALHDFHYDGARARAFGDGVLDCVFVLQKCSRRAVRR